MLPLKLTNLVGLSVPPVPELAPEVLLGPHAQDLLHVDVLDVGGADDHHVDDALQLLVGVPHAEVVEVPPVSVEKCLSNQNDTYYISEFISDTAFPSPKILADL